MPNKYCNYPFSFINQVYNYRFFVFTFYFFLYIYIYIYTFGDRIFTNDIGGFMMGVNFERIGSLTRLYFVVYDTQQTE